MPVGSRSRVSRMLIKTGAMPLSRAHPVPDITLRLT